MYFGSLRGGLTRCTLYVPSSFTMYEIFKRDFEVVFYVIFFMLHFNCWICSLRFGAHEPPLCRLALRAMVLWYFYSSYSNHSRNSMKSVWFELISLLTMGYLLVCILFDDIDSLNGFSRCIGWHVRHMSWMQCFLVIQFNGQRYWSIDRVFFHFRGRGAPESLILSIKGPSLVPDRTLFYKGVFIAS